MRYNPEGDAALNRRQAGRLKRLSEYLRGKGRSLFMFELLVPPEEGGTRQAAWRQEGLRLEIRPRLMVEAIQQLQDAGVEPDVWKIEGLDRREDCERIVAAARSDGRGKVGCIILGRGEDEQKVREWLTIAAGVPGFIGFAVGRTVFWDPLVNWRAGKKSHRRRLQVRSPAATQRLPPLSKRRAPPERRTSRRSRRKPQQGERSCKLGWLGSAEWEQTWCGGCLRAATNAWFSMVAAGQGGASARRRRRQLRHWRRWRGSWKSRVRFG